LIDHDTAKQSVLRYLSTLKSIDGSEWVVDDEKTEEHDVAWLFCWDTKDRLTGKRPRRGLTGNYPILVRKADGALYSWTLLEPLEHALDKLRSGQPALPRLA
jgi:Immunity protein 35